MFVYEEGTLILKAPFKMVSSSMVVKLPAAERGVSEKRIE